MRRIRVDRKIKEVTFKGKPLQDYPYMAIGDRENCRIYYCLHDDEKMNGFDFVVIEASSWASKSGMKWGDHTEIDHIVSGTATNDGLKHTFFGKWIGKDTEFNNVADNVRGYLDFPNSIIMRQIFQGLYTLENMYCGNCWLPDEDKHKI